MWRYRMLPILAGVLLGVAQLDASAGAGCIGDCDGDGSVTVNELVIAVNITLETAPISACPAYADCSGVVIPEVNCLEQAVHNLLADCPVNACGGFAGIRCGSDEVCDLSDPTCALADNAGQCVPFPQVCPDIFNPVCGCNGVTYPNDCERLRAGATLKSPGACPTP